MTNVFDARNQIVASVSPAGQRGTWVYDAALQKVEGQAPDGSVFTVAYDAAGRLIGVRHRDAAGALIDECQLLYDAAGNPILKVTVDGRHTMAYDAANQLLAENHPLGGAKTWTFDPVGNRLSQDQTQVGVRTETLWVYDAADQLQTQTAAGQVTTFVFDAAGNQAVEIAQNGERTTNVWDVENRLREIVLPGGERNTMAYRADGLRHRLHDSEGNKLKIWDRLGTSGYQDLLEENTT
jgi:YD repeat-containing protein